MSSSASPSQRQTSELKAVMNWWKEKGSNKKAALEFNHDFLQKALQQAGNNKTSANIVQTIINIYDQRVDGALITHAINNAVKVIEQAAPHTGIMNAKNFKNSNNKIENANRILQANFMIAIVSKYMQKAPNEDTLLTDWLHDAAKNLPVTHACLYKKELNKPYRKPKSIPTPTETTQTTTQSAVFGQPTAKFTR